MMIRLHVTWIDARDVPARMYAAFSCLMLILLGYRASMEQRSNIEMEEKERRRRELGCFLLILAVLNYDR